MKKFISLFLTICMILSLTSAFTFTASAKSDDDIVKVKVTATPKDAPSNDEKYRVPVKGATVNMYKGQGLKGEDVGWVTSDTTDSEGYAEFDLSAYDEDERAKLTFSAQKVVASGSGIGDGTDGGNRDALFSLYNEPRLQLELHSETIDSNGNWLGKKLPTGNGNDIDLAFVIDASGSMGDDIENVRNNIQEFTEYLADEGYDLRIAIVDYNRGSHGVEVHKTNDYSPWFTDVNDAKDELSKISTTGGTNEPLNSLGYLTDWSSMNWRSSASKFAFLLTDSYIEGSYSAWGYSSIDDVAIALTEENVAASVITTTNQYSVYNNLAEKTGGKMVDIYSSDFASEMKTLADGIVGKAGKDLELHIQEPRLLVNMSMCYYVDDEDDEEYYYSLSSDRIKEFSGFVAQSTDGHVMINKAYLFNTDNRENFYITGYINENDELIIENAPLPSMADIRVVAAINDDGTWWNTPQVHSNGTVTGFYSDDAKNRTINEGAYYYFKEFDELIEGKRDFPRILMSGKRKETTTNNTMAYTDWSKTLTHETGHYLLGLFDEYGYPTSNDDMTCLQWDYGNNLSRPSQASPDFGLMDQGDLMELSDNDDYNYLTPNSSLSEQTVQYAVYKESSEQTLDDFLSEDFSTEYTITYSNRNGLRTAEYPYAVLSDNDIIDCRYGFPTLTLSGGNNHSFAALGSAMSDSIDLSFNNRIQTSENLANINVIANGNKAVLEFTPNDGNVLELYVKKSDGSLGSVIEKVDIANNEAEIELENGRACELIVVTNKDGKVLCNTYILERSFKSDKGYYYQSSDLTVEGYVIPDSEDEFTLMTVGTSFENGDYVSVNNSLKIESANNVGAKGEIYSVASVNGDIDYTTISWFKYADGVYTKLDTDLTTEENMNIGARCDYDGEGTYVLMAKLASDKELQAVTNLDYTNPTDRDGIVELTFDDPNAETVYYNIYYSNKKFSSIDDKDVVMEKRYAGSDSYSIDLGERNTTGYAAVVAIAENGAKSELSDVIRITTGEADRDGDGIPDWYCDKYSLWSESGEEKDIANSDDDKDGLTNLEEYKGGSDPTDPNDPRKTSKTAVKSVSLSDSSISLSPGASSVVTAKLNPSDATNKNVKWYVDDNSIATVSVDGLSCDILGIKEGTTKVTVVTEDGGYTDSVTVKVSNSSSSVSFKPSGKDYYVLKDVAVSNGYEYFDYPEKKSANIRSASYILAFQDNNKLVSYKTVLGDTGIVELDKAIYEDGGKLYVSAIDLQTKLVKYFPNFPTSTPSEWAEEEIARAINAGLVTDSVKVNYQRNITREQFCELVVKLYEKTTGKTVSKEDNRFNDTNNPEILKAYNLGIVNGVSKTKFAPYNLVTRQEICAMLVRAVDAMYPNVDINDYQYHSFSDNDKISSWAMPSVQFAYDNDIMKGVGANEISPLGNTTCEQAILLINRIYESKSRFE